MVAVSRAHKEHTERTVLVRLVLPVHPARPHLSQAPLLLISAHCLFVDLVS